LVGSFHHGTGDVETVGVDMTILPILGPDYSHGIRAAYGTRYFRNM